MAKDPAMLWYWGDWHSGTIIMSRHLKGCYMDLLHAQFNNGPLSLDEIKTILGADFGSWPALQKKFEMDDSGRFFNVRLKIEKEKRAAFVASRNKNLKSESHKDHHMDYRMVDHTDNRDENENSIEFKIKKGVKILGDENEQAILVAAKYVGEVPLRIHGISALRTILENNAVTKMFSDIFLKTFLNEREGAYFNDVRHLVNALNIFQPNNSKNLVDLSDPNL